MNFKGKLLAVVGIFSLLLTFTVSYVDQKRLEHTLISQEEVKRSLVQKNISDAILDIEKVYDLFDQEVEANMKKASEELNAKYQKNPNLDRWDYQAIKEKYGMEVYMIRDGVIKHTSYPKDQGLDFNQVAPDFAKVLQQRVQDGVFAADGMSIETLTGKAKKYSYFPTYDKKYVIEFGYEIVDGPIYQTFDFEKIAKELEEEYPMVDDVTVYMDKVVLGKSDDKGNAIPLDKKFDSLYEKVRDTGKMEQMTEMVNGKKVLHQLIYNKYEGTPDQRVIKITYNFDEMGKTLAENQTFFRSQLAFTMMIALFISYFIAKMVSRPMYLAFNDALTGVSNRAYFEHVLKDKMKKKEKMSVMVLDLDNFKKVNDHLGHDAGDLLLQEVAKRMKQCIRKDTDQVSRLGGDEFTVILSQTTDAEKVSEVARRILEEIKKPLESNGVNIVEEFKVTASIGIAFFPEHGEDMETLYKYADIAMYHAKKSGKNNFKIYVPSLQPEE